MGRIIALTGHMGSGKSTVAQMISDFTPRSLTTLKFAQPLYDMQEYIYDRVGMMVPPPKDRMLLQWLGTEWGRSKDINLWANLWKREAAMFLEMSPTALIVSDDCRYDNEVEVIKELDGIVVKVEASEDARGSRIALTNSTHASERGLSPEKIDVTISNNGNMEDLANAVRAFLAEYRYDR